MSGSILSSRYQIVRPIGRGGFGKTYLAKDIQLPGNPLCVVKQFCPTVNTPHILEIARRLFNTEATALQKLGSHECIPQLFAYFEEGEEFYLVQQYIEGNTLAEELIPGQYWSEEDIVKFLQEGLHILDFVHKQGVIHRDIKPDNLIRRHHDQKIVLVDFGSVKEMINSSTQMVKSTVAIGTSGYMPTEQARGKPRITSDLYALGMIAIQAATGVHPMEFQEDENGELIWPSKDNISSELVDILSKMVRYHFKDRYQSANEILEHLKSLVKESSISRDSNIEESPCLSTFLTSSPLENKQQKSSKKSQNNSFSRIIAWLKSPMGKTLSFVGAIAIMVTGGIYFFNHQAAVAKKNKIDNIINEIESKYDQQNYIACYQQAEKIETQESGVPKKTRIELIRKCRLEAAKEQANSQKLAEAIAIAVKIPKDSSNYQEVQENIDLWSNKILEEANDIYNKDSNLQKALEKIEQIPPTSTIKKLALEQANKWKKDDRDNQDLIMTAKTALEAKDWGKALAEAKQVSGSSYWNKEAKNIIDQAEKAIYEQKIQSELKQEIKPQPRQQIKPQPRQQIKPQPKQEIKPRKKPVVIDVCPGLLCSE
ncbi:MAG: protein kinase [Xenococcus sp. (in: cyanobacteria)]